LYYGFEGVKPANTHFMENEYGWEGSVVIPDVEGYSFAMKFSQPARIGIVD
jgi:hypothetical protein